MKWKKLGMLFCANAENEYMHSGGRTPIVLHIKEDEYKVYFGAYDEFGRGRIFHAKINFNTKDNVELYDLNTNPLIGFGNTGFYDDNGLIPSDILKVDNKVFLYTIGFSVKNKIIFDASSGLAISEDNGETFKKFDGPIIEKSIYDPCFSASPTVMFDDGVFKMWYVSCIKWEKLDNNEFKHYYNIKYKESNDGIHWNIKSSVAIDFKNEYEYALSRPSVIKDGKNDYKMWYSYRAQKNVDKYRIGYAESVDGINWIRKDEDAGIDVSESGWDHEMICYPYVFNHKGARYMLYNGNGYGKTGFGLAILEDI